MANFSIAYKLTANIESGYTIDNGGPTYKGISFKAWSTDPLAKKIAVMVQAAKPRRGQIINNPALDEMIISFYKINYWDKIKGDLVNNQTLANFIYDFYVNSGSALIIINKAVAPRAGAAINENTLKILNERPAFCYDAIKAARKNLYHRLAKKSPVFKTNGTFNGWVARLNSFPSKLV